MRTNEYGVLVVVSGFSGAGKGTVIKELMRKYDNYALSISMTTRTPRLGEVNGSDYFFVSKNEFEDKISKNGFVEYANYCGNYYGTPKEYVEEKLRMGKDVVLEIEIQGAIKVKRKYPATVLVFVMPPSAIELKRRLIGRGTETPEVIDQRLKRAAEEAIGIEEYDYILVNDDLDECVRDLHTVLRGSKNTPARNKALINTIREELKSI